MPEINACLREDVRQLGELLGDAIREQYGPWFLNKIELIRRDAKAVRRGSAEGARQLTATLDGLEGDELLPMARAFNQFLNLTNIAEQYLRIHRRRPNEPEPLENLVLEELLGRLKDTGHASGQLAHQFAGLKIKLVLAAHSAEVARRTLIQKYDTITVQLAAKDHADLLSEERSHIQQHLQRLMIETWHTDEIHKIRPALVSETKWGLTVIEHSLWQALPNVPRHVGEVLLRGIGERLPLIATPLRPVSWMRGDCDDNPNATASMTREVLLLAHWAAIDLYLHDIDRLAAELPMQQASPRPLTRVGDNTKPYRAPLKQLHERLHMVRDWTRQTLTGEVPAAEGVLEYNRNLVEPLQPRHESPRAYSMGAIVGGALFDCPRHAATFSLFLVRLDVRWDSSRHTVVLSEITEYLELGNYDEWDEKTRLGFLLEGLNNRRPLLPAHYQSSADTTGVFATYQAITVAPPTSLGSYVVSMAGQPSDVLAVQLLLKGSDVD